MTLSSGWPSRFLMPCKEQATSRPWESQSLLQPSSGRFTRAISNSLMRLSVLYAVLVSSSAALTTMHFTKSAYVHTMHVQEL